MEQCFSRFWGVHQLQLSRVRWRLWCTWWLTFSDHQISDSQPAKPKVYWNWYVCFWLKPNVYQNLNSLRQCQKWNQNCFKLTASNPCLPVALTIKPFTWQLVLIYGNVSVLPQHNQRWSQRQNGTAVLASIVRSRRVHWLGSVTHRMTAEY